MFVEDITYPEAAGLNHDGDPFLEDSEGEKGGSGERVYSEGSICTDGDVNKVVHIKRMQKIS